MPRWLTTVLARIRSLAAAGMVRFTLKALREAACLGLDSRDAIEIVMHLRAMDSAGRLRSIRTGEWLYLFTPRMGEVVLYLKLALRRDCIVISFHENGVDDHGEEDR